METWLLLQEGDEVTTKSCNSNMFFQSVVFVHHTEHSNKIDKENTEIKVKGLH